MSVARAFASSGPPFVVLGGGPCGLAAAWHLARHGERVLVLEREPNVGGLCATHERDGYRFDLGGHRFVSSDSALTSWLEALLGDDLLTARRKSVVLHEGRAFSYPLEATDLLRNLGVRENLVALLGYARARLGRALARQPPAEVTFEDWVVARFGRPLYDTFFGPYTEKLWGLSPRDISADWAAERISLLDLGDAAARLLHLRQTPIRTYAREYRYPRLGMGQLYEAVAREIAALGGEVRTGVTVTGLEREGARVNAVLCQSERGPGRVPARGVVSTMPLTDLARHLALAGESRRETPSPLRFRSLVFLNLMLSRETIGDSTWMYVASGRLRTSRIQQPNRRSLAMAPPGKTSVMLEIPCDAGDALWNADLPALLALGQRELAALGVDIGPIVGAFSVKVLHGYPIYRVGYEAERQALLRDVSRVVNVRTAGRQGLFRYVFMDAAMQMGTLAAEQLRTGAGEGSAAAIDAIGRSTKVVETLALTA